VWVRPIRSRPYPAEGAKTSSIAFVSRRMRRRGLVLRTARVVGKGRMYVRMCVVRFPKRFLPKVRQKRPKIRYKCLLCRCRGRRSVVQEEISNVEKSITPSEERAQESEPEKEPAGSVAHVKRERTPTEEGESRITG